VSCVCVCARLKGHYPSGALNIAVTLGFMQTYLKSLA
jgi:hypothetical protein